MAPRSSRFSAPPNLDESLRPSIRHLALPAMAHSLLQTLVFVVDRAVLGHHGTSALSAMQLAGPIEWSVVSVFSAFTVGTVAQVGRYVGSQERERARHVAVGSLLLALLLGTLVAILSPLVLPWLASGHEAAASLARHGARNYLKWTLAVTPLTFLGSASFAVLQASGDTRTPLAIGVVANCVHIALNWALVLGHGGFEARGAEGAGMSTAATFVLEAALALFALRRRDREQGTQGVGVPFASLAKEWPLLVRVALPATLERALYHGAFLLYVAMIASLGETIMAANQTLIAVESICFLSADGYAIAAASMVAQKAGSDDRAGMWWTATYATRDSVAILTLFGLMFLGLRHQIVPLFAREAGVAAQALSAMPVLAVAQPFMASAVVRAASLRGAGRTVKTLMVSSLCMGLVRLPTTWVCGVVLQGGLLGVWVGSTVDWVARSLWLGSLLRTTFKPESSSAGGLPTPIP